MTSLLSVQDVAVNFVTGGVGRKRVTQAVKGVSFELQSGETLGLVGESGCGKSTVARTLLLINKPHSGAVYLDGENIHAASRKRRRELRRSIQMIFQDPSGSLNPRMTIDELITEPLVVYGMARGSRQARLNSLLDDVGLPGSVAGRYPHELSGGQLQRASIARALAVEPRILVADEPVSALDVSVQVQIMNLLLDLQIQRKMAYVFISHDLAVVSKMSDRVAVMYLGEIVETGSAKDIFEKPAHPYTQSLLSAVAVPDPGLEKQRERIVLRGDLPSPSDPPQGCAFHTRCWLRSQLDNPAQCVDSRPLLTMADAGHPAACHFSKLLSDDSTRRELVSRAAAESGAAVHAT